MAGSKPWEDKYAAPAIPAGPWTDYSKQAPSMGNSAQEAITGPAVGINKATAAIPGILGDVGQAAYGSMTPKEKSSIGMYTLPGLSYLPTSADTIAAWEKLTGKLPDQKTEVGKYGERMGEMAVGAATSSPLRGIISSVLSGGASKGLEDLTSLYTNSPIAKGVASTVGGLAGLLLGNAGAFKDVPAQAANIASNMAKKQGLTLEGVGQQVDNAYNQLDAANIDLPNALVKGKSNELKRELKDAGITSGIAPKAISPAESFHALPGDVPQGHWTDMNGSPYTSTSSGPKVWVPAGPPASVPFNELNAVRKEAGNVAFDKSPSVSPTERYGAGKVRDKVNETIQAGLPPDKQAQFATANELASREIEARKLAAMREKSDFYVGGGESGARAQAATELKKNYGLMDAVQKAALLKVMGNTPLGNIIRDAGGRMSPAIGAFIAGLPGYLVGQALKTGVKSISGTASINALKKAENAALVGKAGRAEALSKAEDIAAQKTRNITGGLISAVQGGYRGRQ